MRFRCTSALSGAVLALATAIGFGPASADVVTVIATGTTTSDPTGLFGQLGSDVTVTYTFDTTLGIYSHDALFTEVFVSGGTVHGVTSPSLGATVTTDARTITFAGAFNAELWASTIPRSAAPIVRQSRTASHPSLNPTCTLGTRFC